MYKTSRRTGRGRKRGRGVREVLSKIHGFLKKHKLLSRGANVLGQVLPEKYRGYASKAGQVASTMGYGRRTRGGLLRLGGT